MKVQFVLFIKGNESDAYVAEAPGLDISDILTIKISLFFFLYFNIPNITCPENKRNK